MKTTIAAALLIAAGLLTGCSDSAPKDCDPSTDYVCKPDVKTGTSSVPVPQTSVTTSLSPTVTTTVVP